MPNKQYVVHDNEVFEKIENDLFTSYKPVEVPKAKALTAEWHGAKIPFDMWSEIMAFMKASQAKFSSETMLFLYYDESKEQPWDFWVPPQETAGMTVKSSPNDPEFSKQRALYPDVMFGTVHHHCTSTAFQSGTDEADETTREGFHFTVGKLGKDQESEVHARLTLAGVHYVFDNLDMIIETDINPFKDGVDLDDNMLDFIEQYRNRAISRVPDNWAEYNFTDQFDNVSKKTYSYKGYGKAAYQASPAYQNSFSWADSWDTDDMTPVKKTGDTVDQDDLVEELVDYISTSWTGEEHILNYYTEYESKNHQELNDLTLGNTSDEEYRRVVTEMCNNEIYLSSMDGKEFTKLVETFLDDYTSLGYNFSFQDIQEQSIFNENRSAIQHMVKKGLS